jgi:hypothetical protein
MPPATPYPALGQGLSRPIPARRACRPIGAGRPWVGPQRRDCRLTEAGYAALDEWAAAMQERSRLIAEFDARYRKR